MAITTYAELKTAVYGWLDTVSGDFSGTLIDDLIMAGEKKIFRTMRTREMEASLSATISSGVVPTPADFVDVKYAYLSNQQPYQWLEKRLAAYVYQNFPYRGASGEPRVVAREFTNLIFGPYPSTSTTYIVQGVYWKRLGALASGVNALFTNNPDLYLWASLSEADAILGRDSRAVQMWEAKFQQARRDIMMEVQDEGYEGSEMSPG